MEEEDEPPVDGSKPRKLTKAARLAADDSAADDESESDVRKCGRSACTVTLRKDKSPIKRPCKFASV